MTSLLLEPKRRGWLSSESQRKSVWLEDLKKMGQGQKECVWETADSEKKEEEGGSNYTVHKHWFSSFKERTFISNYPHCSEVLHPLSAEHMHTDALTHHQLRQSHRVNNTFPLLDAQIQKLAKTITHELERRK